MTNKSKKYHYLYKTTNLINNKYYYGMHSTNNLDDNYLGSGKKLRYSIRKYGKENFKREILQMFDTREELAKAEKELITEEILKDKYCMNILFGGEEWNTLGMVSVRDMNGKTFKVFNDDPRYLSGELIHNITGFVVVRDKDGNILHVPKDDERYLNGELVGVTKGMVTVKDKEGNTLQVSKNDERYLNEELVGVTKGMVTVKDKNNNTCKVSKDDERYLSGELVGIFKDKKHSNETKIKISEKAKERIGDKNSQFGTCWITKDNENKKIKKEDLDQYISIGWSKGRILKIKNNVL